jgi:hypothetical protein
VCPARFYRCCVSRTRRSDWLRHFAVAIVERGFPGARLVEVRNRWPAVIDASAAGCRHSYLLDVAEEDCAGYGLPLDRSQGSVVAPRLQAW